MTGVFIMALSLVPQIIKLRREKELGTLSLTSLVIFLLAGLLWLIYGLQTKDLYLTTANTFFILVDIILLVVAIRYNNRQRHYRFGGEHGQ